MKRFLSWYGALLMTLLLAACGGEDGGAPSQADQGGGTGITIKSLALTPAQGSIPVGLGQQFIALATMSDGSVREITNDAVLHWSSSNESVATISATGLALGIAPGKVSITATGTAMGAHFSATAELTVTSPVVMALQVTPSTVSIPVGFEQIFVATAILSDGSSLDVTNNAALSWSSSDPAIASIDNKGLVIAQAAGTVTITANSANFSASAKLTVTSAVVTALQITPAIAAIPVGFEQAFVATAILSDGSSLDITNSAALSWSSSDPAIASIDNGSHKGLTTAKAVGSVTIIASGTAKGANFSATAKLAVTNAVVTALQVTPAIASLPIGFEQVFVATAFLSDGSLLDITNSAALSWSSSDPAIASIDNGSHKGLATAKAVGDVTITASGTAKGVSFSATAKLTATNAVVTALQVTPVTASVPAGFEQSFIATAIMSDGRSLDITGNAALSWSSSNPAIATIDGISGLATGKAPGDVTITAAGTANGTHFSAIAALTVTAALVTSLQISPATASIPVGFEQSFITTAILSDGSSLDITNNAALSWSSSDPAIATIGSNGGLATGITTGSATITASGTTNGTHFSATAALTVTDAVVTMLHVNPPTASVPVGFEQAFIATVFLSDGSSLDITNSAALSWTSSDPGIATILNGKATGRAEGSVTITAAGTAKGTNFSATATLAVTSAVVIGIQITPAAGSVPVGLQQQFVATALLSDGSLLDITNNAALSWSSSDPTLATIGSNNGLAEGIALGNVIIAASGTVGGVPFNATAPLTVTSALVTGLQITPATASVQAGFEQQYVAMASLSDGSTLDITSNTALNWSSSDQSIAIVASGLATGKTEGTVTITASGTSNGASFSATAELAVTVPKGCDMGSLTHLGLVFICPLTQTEADAAGIVYETPWLEPGGMFVLMTWAQGETYCNNLGSGYRLPTRQELKDLYFRYGPLHTYAGWPFTFTYWTSTGVAGTHQDVNITNGYADERADTSPVYVSCVRSNI